MSWDAHFDDARQLERAGDHAAAELEYARLSELGSDAERARARARLAGVKREQGRLEDSEREAAAAFQLAERSNDTEAIAAARVELAIGSLERGKLEEAEAELAAANPQAAETRLGALEVAGSVERARSRYPEAEKILRQAIELAESSFGEDSVETATALNFLGMNYKFWGRFDEGMTAYERALAIVGESHPLAASLYHNLGGLEHARRRFEEAEPYARRSVELRRQRLEPGNPAIATDEAALASILHELGQDGEAEELLRGALPVLERQVGPDSSEAMVARNNLAAVLESRGDHDEAEALYRATLEAKERVLGPEHPSVAATLNNLAVLLRRRGRADEAAELYARAVAVLERTLDPSHPNLLAVRRNYERLQAERGKIAADDAV